MSNEHDLHSLELNYSKHPTSDAFVPLCEAYLQHKRYMEAMLVCKKGIKNLPGDPRGRLLLARVYTEQGKAPKAEQELTQLLETFPDNMDGLKMQADIYKQSQRKAEAIALLQKIRQLAPDRADIKDELKALGVVVDVPPPRPPPRPALGASGPPSLGGPPASVQDVFGDEQVHEDAGQAAPMQYQMRPSLYNAVAPPKKGNPKFTIGIIVVFIVGFGTFITLYFNHVQNIRKIDQIVREARPNLEKNTYPGVKLALEGYGKILEIESKNAFALGATAYLYEWLAGEQLVSEDKAKAQNYLAQAMASKEDNQYRVSAEAMAKLYAGDAKGAADLLQGDRNRGAGPLSLLVLSDAQWALGQIAEMRETLTRASGLSAADNHVLVRLGESYLDEGKYESSRGYFEQVLSQENAHPGALIGRIFADLGKKQENVEAAQKDFDKLSSTPPEYLTPKWKAGMLWAKGLLELKAGKGGDAAKSFDEANKIDPNDLRFLAVRARVYQSLNMLPEAISDYRAVLDKKSDLRPLQVNLALTFAGAGKSQESMALLDKLLSKDASDTELLFVKARALKAQNKFDEAVATYQKILAANKGNIDAKLELATTYRQKPDFAKAADVLTTMVKSKEAKGHAYSLVMLELGRVYADQGDLERAKQSFVDVISKEAAFPDTYFFLGKMLKGKPQKEALARYLSLAPSGAYASEAERLLRSSR